MYQFNHSCDTTLLLNQNTQISQKFYNILVCASLWHTYHMTKAVQAMENTHSTRWYHGSWCAYILCIASLHMKATQMNVQHSLDQELMVLEFELSHNITEATKTVCFVKGEGAIDHNIVIRSFKKYSLNHKTLKALKL